MFRCLIVLFLILLTDFSFGQVVLTQTHSDATIGIDRKAWNGLGNTSSHSDGYAHDFTLPASTNPCQKITGIAVEISHTGYTNNNVCPHFETYYNLFYGCTSYTGGATCLPATNLIAEPNYAPNTNPPPFNFGSPLGSPLNSNIVPDFGDNLSIDIIPVSNPGCNPVTNGHISYQYTITVTVTITDLPPTPPTFTQVSAICSGDTLSALTTTSNEGITGTWSPALDNTSTTTYTFTPNTGQCATSQTMTITVNTPVTPTLECWETATFNNTSCSWDVTGTQPTQPTLECWETATFNNTTCVWDVTGTQPTQPTLECWETATFNNTTCVWDVTGTQPTQPTLECWETATFNNSTCTWDISGTQPPQPTLECWETATFNNTTCSWDVTGTQPLAPTDLACWETATFNNVTCVWDITGTQPLEFEEEHLTFCEGEDITMFANTTLVTPTYLWDTGETTDSKTVSVAGTYVVEVTDNCTTIEITFYFEEIETPIIESVISDGSSIVISTSNTGDFLYSLDGNSFQTNNIFDDQDGGLYTIYVKGQGCNDVVTSNHLHFYIPKFFTPNKDSVNDTFDLKGIEYFGESQVHIFDRYGKLLKSSRKNVPFSWNGTFNNVLLRSDDYWYIIIIDGQQFAGHFSLKR